MREINSDELKKIQLDILIDFAKFCDENDITYYLAGGTLLGAVRHSGFIPWDDDIDVMMPRNDFEKAVSLYNHKYYRFNYITNSREWFEPTGKICDTRTYVFCDSFKNTEINEFNCVAIDVCPIDGLPNSELKQKVLFLLSNVLIAIHSSSVLTFKVTKRYEDKDAGLLRWKKYFRTAIKYLFICLFGRTNPRFWIKLLNDVVTKESFYSNNFVAALVSCVHGSKEKMPIEIYEPKVFMNFESYKFSCPIGYDYYLKRLYGNYMELPPVEKRQSHHNFKAYWK